MRPLGGFGPAALVVALLVSGIPLALAGSAPGRVANDDSALGVTLTANPVSGFAPLSVDFTLTLPANTTPPVVSWSFGDGAYLNGTGGSVLTPVHVFVGSGEFRTVATATWPAGAVNASLTITVALANLTVQIHGNVSAGTAPVDVAFAASPAGGTGTFVSFLWSFGDGDSGTGPAVQYTFASAGHYSVAVTVTDSRGDAGASTTWVNVSAAPASNGSNATDPGKNATPSGGARAGGGVWNRIVSSGLLLPLLGVALTVLAVGLFLAFRAGQLGRGGRPSRTVAPRPILGSGPPRPNPSMSSTGPRPCGPAPPEVGTARLEVAVADAGPSAPGLPAGLTQERQIANRLIRHLAELPRWAPGDTPGVERTQAGIVRALGAGQSAVSRVLSQLERAGVVSVVSTRVAGAPRQLKVYRLSPRGERLGFALRESGPRR